MNHLPQTTPSATAMVGSSSRSPSNDGGPAYPYPGLRPFQPEESAIFFGRGEQTGEMLTRLEDHRFLAVVGASGCGKSSLVRAGLLPALEQGFLATDSDPWRFVIMRPGDAPLRNLASELARSLGPQTSPDESNTVADQADPHRVAMIRAGLRSGPKGLVQVVDDARLPADTNVLVLVDQFEELFRFRHRNKSLDSQSDEGSRAAERDEAAALVSLLLATAAQRDRPIYVVITMRSDFLGDCDAFFGLPEAINDSQFLTPRMTRDQARDAIVEPARLFGGDVEPALVNRILNEIGNDPDQLPLMQHALMRAWRHAEKERGRPVTIQLADYERLGGLKRALANHADYVLEHLASDADHRVAEMLFRALCDGSAEQRLTRRLATVAEIAAIAGVEVDDVIRVANAFRSPGRNFVTPPSDISLIADSTLDISHESLIRQWGTLQTWLAREEQSARIYRRLSETAKLWHAGHAALFRPPDLDLALEWKKSEHPTATWASRYDTDFPSVMRFLDESRLAEEGRTRAERDRNARELAAAQELASEQQARAVGFRRMSMIVGAVAIFAICFLVLAIAAQHNAKVAEQKAIEHAAEADEARTNSETLATAREEQLIEANHNLGLALLERASKYHEDGKYTHAYVTAGRAIGFDGCGGPLDTFPCLLRPGSDFLRASTIARRCASLSHWPDEILMDTGLGLMGMAVHPASKRIAVENLSRREIHVLDIDSREITARLTGYESGITPLAFSPDGFSLATGHHDGKIRIWDLSSQVDNVIADLSGHVYRLAFSSDGRFLAAGGEGQDFGAVWDLEKWDEPAFHLADSGNRVFGVAFAPTLPYVVSGTASGQISIHDTHSGRLLKNIAAHSNNVWSLAFHDNGDQFASSGGDGRIKVWSLSKLLATADSETSSESLATIDAHADQVGGVTFSPDGNILASAGWDGTIRLWDSVSWQPLATLDGHNSRVDALAFAADSMSLVTAEIKGTIRVWQLTGNYVTRPYLNAHARPVGALALHPTQDVLASGGWDGGILLWDTNTWHATSLPSHSGNVTAICFGPSGDRLFAAGNDGKIFAINIDVPDGSPVIIGDDAFAGWIQSVDISPDESILASAGPDGQVRLWNTTTGTLMRKLDTHSERVHSVFFASSGDRLMSSGSDGRICVWETEEWTQIQELHAHGAQGQGMVLSSDERYIISAGWDGKIHITDSQSWERVKSLEVGVNLTARIVVTRDMSRIAVTASDRTVRIYNLDEMREIAVMPENTYLYSLVLLHDGGTLAYPGENGTIKFMQMQPSGIPAIDATQFHFNGLDVVFGTSE